METINNIRNWASILDDVTRLQAERTARLPILAGPLALMPDAHLGVGATIGTVIPTESAVIPSAVGVDIGCGMAAMRTPFTIDVLLDRIRLADWVTECARTIPAGLGKWDAESSTDADNWLRKNPSPETLAKPERAGVQLGTLGGGNHFIELATDELNHVWVLLHSGSRGAGNQLATLHTRIAKEICKSAEITLEDPELAWLQENTPEFELYIRDLRWAQAYALENRRQLLERAYQAVFNVLDWTYWTPLQIINCHHNYTDLELVPCEKHVIDTSTTCDNCKFLWITRKGAIRAGVGEFGLIPGSMGQKSYIVKGKGNPLSYNSCSHGAGRVMSRRKAKQELALGDFITDMEGVAWQNKSMENLLDEAPRAYKPIDQVMRDQADLVEVVHELKAVANYKGVESSRRKH